LDPTENPDPTNGPGIADPNVDPGAGQAFDWESDENPYKTRFETYRSEADRRNTKLSQYEQNLADLRSGDPDRQQAAAEALGIELVYDEPDEPEYDDPYDELAARQEALEQRLAHEAETRQQEAMANEVEARLAKLDGLDESDKDLVLARAIALPPGEDGLPDIQKAYDELTARDQARVEAAMRDWAKRKRAPSSIQPGSTATQQKSVADMTQHGLLNAEGLDYFAQRLEDMSAQ
jgi:hypothetical protein